MLLDGQRGGIARTGRLFLSHFAQCERVDGTAELYSQVEPRYTCRSLICMLKAIIWFECHWFFSPKGW